MPRISLALLLCAVIAGVRLAAGDAPPAPAPATTAAALPEQTLLAWTKVLQADDYTALLAMLPPEVQAKAVASWTNADSSQDKDIDENLAKVLAPAAVDGFMNELTPKLATLDPAGLAQNLVGIAGFLPLLLQQGQPSAPNPDSTPIITAAQSLLSDMAAWLPTSGITDPANLRKALTDLVDAVKGTGITSAADLHKMSLADFLGKLGPAVKKAKEAFMVYGLDANKLLASITASSAAGADANHRTLTIGFSAFARTYSFTLPLVQANGIWTVPAAAIPGYNYLKAMVPAARTLPGAAAPDADEGKKAEAAPAPAPAPASGPSGQGK
jgi:hypothetical protein